MASRTEKQRAGGSESGPGTVRSDAATPASLYRDYGLPRALFARMVGVPETAVTAWESGRAKPDAASRERLQKAGEILEGLARVMRKAFIPTWLEQPNDACREVGGRAPLDLLERGDHAAVERMIYFFEAGEPF